MVLSLMEGVFRRLMIEGRKLFFRLGGHSFKLLYFLQEEEGTTGVGQVFDYGGREAQWTEEGETMCGRHPHLLYTIFSSEPKGKQPKVNQVYPTGPLLTCLAWQTICFPTKVCPSGSTLLNRLRSRKLNHRFISEPKSLMRNNNSLL